MRIHEQKRFYKEVSCGMTVSYADFDWTDFKFESK